ncbi:hypothetical protein [Streptomyces fagopyri]|uniref:hypothetical protein n=1 Tax=Streptomyces fagopyri TaxID=2662397 RepID=UPI003713C3BF
MAALLVGVTFSRYVSRAGALAEMSAERFTEDLTTATAALTRSRRDGLAAGTAGTAGAAGAAGATASRRPPSGPGASGAAP